MFTLELKLGVMPPSLFKVALGVSSCSYHNNSVQFGVFTLRMTMGVIPRSVEMLATPLLGSDILLLDSYKISQLPSGWIEDGT